jgi:hypothetical protein
MMAFAEVGTRLGQVASCLWWKGTSRPRSHVGLSSRGAHAERRTRDGRTHGSGDIHYQNRGDSASHLENSAIHRHRRHERHERYSSLYLWIFYVTVNRWRIRGASHHRHDYRHRRNALPKRLTRRRDGDDAHLRVYSRQGCAATSYALLPWQLNPTYPTHKTRSPLPMRPLRPLAPSGLSNLPENPTPTPDEKNGSSSGLSRASSGQQPEPDDNKHLTYAGYSGYRRVCRVL